jgi:creatinine amidohydrolase
MADWGDTSIKFHNWWRAPRTWAFVQEHGGGSHASWMENFPWTRLSHATVPAGIKAMVDFDQLRASPPAVSRVLLGDGNFGGAWQKPDEVSRALWQIGVEETRAAMEGPWA